jgi:hypothetical protein
MAHALVGVVVEIEVRDFDFAGGQRFRIHAESVILCSDFDLIGKQVFYRMVRTVVAEFELECFAAKRDAANLVPETDSEDRHFADELSDIFNRIAHRLGVAGAV